MGSRDQRVDLGTLHGGPKAKQVGGEMATAIRRRMLRQQATLREKVNRDKGRLDNDIGYNKGCAARSSSGGSSGSTTCRG